VGKYQQIEELGTVLYAQLKCFCFHSRVLPKVKFLNVDAPKIKT